MLMKSLFLVHLFEVTPVVKIDGEQVGDGKVGPVTRQLQEGFNKYIESRSS